MKKQPYENTLGALSRLAAYHERQRDLVTLAHRALTCGASFVFEGHIRGDGPLYRSIMAQGMTPEEAVKNARTLWTQYNDQPNSPLVEVFATVPGFNIRFALMPDDLSGLHVTLNHRLYGDNEPIVFNLFEILPGANYTTTPTPPLPVPAA